MKQPVKICDRPDMDPDDRDKTAFCLCGKAVPWVTCGDPKCREAHRTEFEVKLAPRKSPARIMSPRFAGARPLRPLVATFETDEPIGEYEERRCKICGEPQWTNSRGITCPNGHEN